MPQRFQNAPVPLSPKGLIVQRLLAYLVLIHNFSAQATRMLLNPEFTHYELEMSVSGVGLRKSGFCLV